ncbi:hypothetical protein [Sulfitobacter dubius]|uniref:hypothetical protein n=1 Tax=Sulfitobacter dubius TaxID=218673 RepID=UPI0029422CCE|nr:hypothetical protein [Sulfitobacter dubius]WOI28722.1 hypothetical protein R1T39_13685 [Sulfitobacter dubius]
MTEVAKFDECFERAFAGGLSDIKFFVRKSEHITTDQLMGEALAFQCAIEEGRVKEILSVD